MDTKDQLAADEALIDALATPKVPGRLKRVLKSRKPKEAPRPWVARVHHTDPKTGKVETTEILGVAPRPLPLPRVFPFYTKEYEVKNEEGTVVGIEEKTFGPYHTNRAIRRLFSQSIMREALRRNRKRQRAKASAA